MKTQLTAWFLGVCFVVSLLSFAFNILWPLALLLWLGFVLFYRYQSLNKEEHKNPESYLDEPLSLVLGGYWIYTKIDVYARHGDWVNFMNGAMVSITNGFEASGSGLYVLDRGGRQVYPRLH